MAKPQLVFVPGLWEGPRVFDAVRDILSKQDFNTTVAPLLSTGKTNSANASRVYTMQDDMQAIRQVVEPLITEHGTDVVMVLHSMGGVLGSSAIEGLSKNARSAKGLAGGVTKIIFVTAGVAPEGYEHTAQPFMDIKGDEMWCKAPRHLLYNDVLDDAEAETYVQRLECQPATGWDGTVTYAGWKDVSSVYLVCEKDAVIPKEWQEKLAGMAGSEVVTLNAAHMPQVTQPQALADALVKAVSG